MNDWHRESFNVIAGESDHPEEELDHALMMMHFAWGGRLLFNGRVIWRDYCRVDELVPVGKGCSEVGVR